MRHSTKMSLILAVTIMLIVVLAAWFASTRESYEISTALTRIDYVPPALAKGAYLTFTFSAPLPAGVAVSSATLQSFVATASGAPFTADQTALVQRLIAGPPFVPTTNGAFIATTNTLPVGLPAVAVSVDGLGTMRFAKA